MEQAKTLWLLDIQRGAWGQLIPLYAADEEEAWVEAHRWAVRNETPLPSDAALVHFPVGFTVHHQTISGTLKGE